MLCLSADLLGGLIAPSSSPCVPLLSFLPCPAAVPKLRLLGVMPASLRAVTLLWSPGPPGLMLALGIALPAMTRFLLESRRAVKCLTRSVMAFMSRTIPSVRRSLIALGVMPVAV